VLVTGLDARIGGFRLAPSALFSLDGLRTRLRAVAGIRAFGPRAWPEAPASSGSFFDLDLAATYGVHTAERFSTFQIEMLPHGRLDFEDLLGPDLRGAFTELGIGFAVQRTSYDLPDEAEVPADYALQLLGRFGFGVYLGSSEAPRSEIFVYYDHRHDDEAAGLTHSLVGIAGHFGVESTIYLTPELGLRPRFELGGASVAGLSVLTRYGGPSR
jgi:hypothetical protein